MTTAMLGFFAGTLHVFAGPDHLAAGTAFRSEQTGGAWYYGAIWALGHGAGLTIIGLAYYFLVETRVLTSVALFAERLVGVSLIWVGTWILLRRNRPWSGACDAAQGNPKRGGAMAIGFGVLHGTAGATHLLGLIPMFTLQRNSEVVMYLLAYNTGILCAMSLFCGLLGIVFHRTSRAGGDAILKFRVITSLTCLLVGSYWLIV